jgi:hypothetical protein
MSHSVTPNGAPTDRTYRLLRTKVLVRASLAADSKRNGRLLRARLDEPTLLCLICKRTQKLGARLALGVFGARNCKRGNEVPRKSSLPKHVPRPIGDPRST